MLIEREYQQVPFILSAAIHRVSHNSKGNKNKTANAVTRHNKNRRKLSRNVRRKLLLSKVAEFFSDFKWNFL